MEARILKFPSKEKKLERHLESLINDLPWEISELIDSEELHRHVEEAVVPFMVKLIMRNEKELKIRGFEKALGRTFLRIMVELCWL